MTRHCAVYMQTQLLFSPSVQIKCSICSYHQSQTRTPVTFFSWEWTLFYLWASNLDLDLFTVIFPKSFLTFFLLNTSVCVHCSCTVVTLHRCCSVVVHVNESWFILSGCHSSLWVQVRNNLHHGHCMSLIWSISTCYHSAENNLERFRVFFDLISRFEFDFCRCGFFLMIQICGVFEVQSHAMRLYMYVHVLWLVCTHTIPFRMLLCPWRFMMTCVYMYKNICKKRKMWTYTNMYMYMCVFSSRRDPTFELQVKPCWSSDIDVRYTWREERRTNRTAHLLIPSAVSLRRGGVEQLYQVKRMIGGRENMFVSVQCQNVKVMQSQTSVGKRPSSLS